MKKLISVPLAVALLAPALTAPYATADDPETCENPGYTITSGELKWGIKESWRIYITGSIAKGDWKTTSNITEAGDRKAEDFQFTFPVDPATSRVSVNSDGELLGADIETKPNAIVFNGHHGALSSTFISPYVRTIGKRALAGTGYVGYYVPNQSMTSYSPDDRVPKNRVEGKDTFAAGAVSNWKVTEQEGDNVTLEFTSKDLLIAPKTGTWSKKISSGEWQSAIDGVDIIFLGTYAKDYKPELDNYTVSLNATKTCLSESDATTLNKELTSKHLSTEYKTERGEQSLMPEDKKKLFTELNPGLDIETGTPNSGPKPPSDTAEDTPEDTDNNGGNADNNPAGSNADNNPGGSNADNNNSGSGNNQDNGWGKIHDGWSIFLAVLGSISMFAILAKLLIDVIKPFIPKF